MDRLEVGVNHCLTFLFRKIAAGGGIKNWDFEINLDLHVTDLGSIEEDLNDIEV